MPAFRSNSPEARRRGARNRCAEFLPGPTLAALVLVAAASRAAAVTGDDVCRMFREKSIPFDSNTVQRAAVNAMLMEVDPRALLLSPADAASQDSGQTVVAAEKWPEGIAYMKLGGLYDGGASNVGDRLVEWTAQDLEGLIMDVRGAAGTSLETVDQVCGMFVPADTPLYEVSDASSRVLELHSAPSSPITPRRPPLMLITDGTTRDASEVLCAALKGRPGVMLVGAPTLGDTGLREVIPLSSNLLVYVATRRVRPIGADDFAGRGVLPDVELSQVKANGAAAVRPENGGVIKPLSAKARKDRNLMLRVAGDPPLMRAVDILLGLKALRPDAPPAGAVVEAESAPDG